jgi:hypothetical protein
LGILYKKMVLKSETGLNPELPEFTDCSHQISPHFPAM